MKCHEFIDHRTNPRMSVTITANISRRTFTIRKYQNGKCYATYRTIPQSKDDFNYYCDFATHGDWMQFLKTDEYYLVR